MVGVLIPDPSMEFLLDEIGDRQDSWRVFSV